MHVPPSLTVVVAQWQYLNLKFFIPNQTHYQPTAYYNPHNDPYLRSSILPMKSSRLSMPLRLLLFAYPTSSLTSHSILLCPFTPLTTDFASFHKSFKDSSILFTSEFFTSFLSPFSSPSTGFMRSRSSFATVGSEFRITCDKMIVEAWKRWWKMSLSR